MKIAPFDSLVWGSLRLAPINKSMSESHTSELNCRITVYVFYVYRTSIACTHVLCTDNFAAMKILPAELFCKTTDSGSVKIFSHKKNPIWYLTVFLSGTSTCMLSSCFVDKYTIINLTPPV